MSKETLDKIVENIYNEEFSSLKKEELDKICLNSTYIEHLKTDVANNLLEKKENKNVKQKTHSQTYGKFNSNHDAIKDHHGTKKNILYPSLMKKHKNKEFKRTKR